LAALSVEQLERLVQRGGRDLLALAEGVLSAKNEVVGLQRELSEATRLAEVAKAQLAEAEREVRDGERGRSKRLLPLATAQELRHEAEVRPTLRRGTCARLKRRSERRRELVPA